MNIFIGCSKQNLIAFYGNGNMTLCRIVFRRLPLIHVGRLSVTCRDVLRAPVLRQSRIIGYTKSDRLIALEDRKRR